MKIIKSKSFFLIIFFFSIYISSILWDLIVIEYENPHIIGEYSKNEYNAINDILRYFIFLSSPTFVFIVYKFYKEKNSIQKISNFFKKSYNERNLLKQNLNLNIIFLIIVLLQILIFFSIEFSTAPIDSFHEGQKMGSAYRNFLDNTLWSKSYVTVGIFYETLSSSFFWKIFDNISIGVTRFADLFYILIFKISLITLIYLLSKITRLDFFKQIIFFLFNSLISTNLIDYNLVSLDLISYREITIIILSIFIYFLIINYKVNLTIFFISLMSPVSLILSIDRGLICNLIILVVFFYLILAKRNKESFLLIFFFTFSWFTTFLILGEEFYYFINNTFLIYKEMSYIHGLIHPTPFSNQPNSSRATKTMLLILICIIISINSMFKKKYSNEFVKFLIFFTIISIGSYLYALGRSDGAHIKNSFGYPVITFLFFISYIFLKKIHNFSRLNQKIFSLILIIIFIIGSNLNLEKILSFNSRFKNYIHLDDKIFLSSQEIKFIEFLKPIVEAYDCVQLFNNDAILYYLLRKKSCTKFYFIWSASSPYNQARFINDLVNTKIIIGGGNKNNWHFTMEKKLYLTDKYIKDNYVLLEAFNDWYVLIKKR